MLRFSLGLIFIILAVGAIDGPTGHEGDAWHLTFIFGALGFAPSLTSWGERCVGNDNTYADLPPGGGQSA